MICTICKIDKPTASFYVRKDGNRKRTRSSCKSCCAKQATKYYEANKSKHRRTSRRYSLRVNYGISLETFERLALAQDGKCRICQQVRGLVVDHNHITGEYRGLLCRQCNAAIGVLGDNVEGLERALTYLRRCNG